MLTKIATIIAMVVVPTKLLVRYLRRHADQVAKTVEGQQLLTKLDQFPDTWRPPILMTMTELKRAMS